MTLRLSLDVTYSSSHFPPTGGERQNRLPEISDMMQAIWNGTVVAESASTEIVEGNHYFPPSALRQEFFQKSDTQTVCPWKGTASYYAIIVDDKANKDAAWYYPEPKSAASNIANRVAFWKGVDVRHVS